MYPLIQFLKIIAYFPDIEHLMSVAYYWMDIYLIFLMKFYVEKL